MIVEDDAFVGGGCGLYEGVIVGRRRGPRRGRRSSPGSGRLIDLVEERELRGTPDAAAGRAREDAVVVPGSRPVRVGLAARRPASV